MAKPKGQDSLVLDVRQRLDWAYGADRHNRIDAAQDLKFLAGDQWPANVRLERQAANRPVLTLNRLPQFTNQVVNDFKQNPPVLKVTPADSQSDDSTVDIYNGILNELQYQSNAISVYGNAFGHAVSCGIGHFRIGTGYIADDSFDQQITVQRISNPLSVYWDPDAIEPDRSDAKFCIVTDLMTKQAFKSAYPKASPTNIDVPTDGIQSWLYWSSGDMVRVAEYWQKKPVKLKLALLENGQTLDITKLKHNDLQFLPAVVREREVDTFKVVQSLVSGAEILDGENDWAGKYIPIIPVIGCEVPLEDKIIRYGLVRFARDPQQLYNYWRSAAAETIALAPKAPFLVTPTMIGEFKAQWDSHNTTTRPYLLYKPDPMAPGGKPDRAMPPPVPAALVQEASIASDDMKATTGVYDASLGQRSNETSGRAIVARDRQSDVGTYQYMDNFNTSLTYAGRVMIDLIPKIYDSERVVRLKTEEHEDPKFATVNQEQMGVDGSPIVANDLSKGRFDCRVKLGPSFATRRLEAADSMMKFIQAVPQAAQVAGDLIATAMDWPDAEKLAERLRRMIPPNILGEDAPQPDPQQQQAQQQQQAMQQQAAQLQQQMVQVELALKQAQVQKTGSEAQLKAADAALRQAQAAITGMHAQMQQNGVPMNMPSGGYPSMNPEGPGQAPAQQDQGPHPIHEEVGAVLKNALLQQTVRAKTALADKAEADVQGRIQRNQIDRVKFFAPERFGLSGA